MEQYERDNIARLRPYLPECTVLLRKNGEFPLDGPCRIFACGSGSKFTVKGGTGSGEVNSRYSVSVWDGLRQAGFDVFGSIWAEQYKEYQEHAKKDFNESIRRKAREEHLNIISASMGAVVLAPEYDIPLNMNCDAAIYVLSRISGEGNDRLPEQGDFKLTDSEIRDILALDAGYKKFMLVINAGGPVDLSPVSEVGNILVLSQLGVETGNALADILLGKAYPSGKLATTWSMYEDYSTAGDFGGRDDTRYREGIYVGYRYFDAFGAEPMYPFGYGLGYTDFRTSVRGILAEGSVVTVSVRVTNKGKYPGKETVQVYVSSPSGRLDREVKSLAGFAKTPELAPGRTRTVKVSFDMRDLAGYDQACPGWILEGGDYIVLAGTSSADVSPAAVIRVPGDVTVREAASLFPVPDFEDIRNYKDRQWDTEGLEVIEMDPACLVKDAPESRALKERSYPELDGLTARELAILNIGAFDPGRKLPSIIGDSATTVAGAAGESSRLFEGRGIGRIIMSDGPAGVRIASKYYKDLKGSHALTSSIPEGIIDMLPAAAGKMLSIVSRPKRGVTVQEQYCTAIPVAAAIAQSFNTELAEVCGDIVADEMERYGIDLWLAPALNIHRNVLCGRNFEYYSEDPLVSGIMAAAITRGVQKHPGRGVTIKHFACNNQETNRYASNSIVSERALREIYLRGFEICIRESDPMALMTSYNLLDGEHTSESRALTTDILYGEMGFDGLVMTDWVIGGGMLIAPGSKYGAPDAAKVAAAGCSLFMPGSRKDYDEIIRGLEDGTVTEEQLAWNAGRIVRVLERLGRRR